MTSLPLFLISIICFSAIAFAGNLTPPAGSPSPTMFSLEQIYNSIAGSSYDSSGFSADVDGNVHEQLKYIASIISAGYTYGDEDPDYVLTTADGAGTYDATNLTPENVAEGIEFGVDSEGEMLGDTDPEYVVATAEYPGTLLYNTFNGTRSAGSAPGGSQANGGTDDYNNGSAPPSNAYRTSWTKCNSGNSYCGTSDNRASAMDNVTGLIWSYPCSGTNCSNMTNEAVDTYNHATALTNCSSKTPWRLPHQKQLMVAYANGAYGNDALEPQANGRNYWSATTYSPDTGRAWAVSLSRGVTNDNSKTSSSFVRCVRSAI